MIIPKYIEIVGTTKYFSQRYKSYHECSIQFKKDERQDTKLIYQLVYHAISLWLILSIREEPDHGRFIMDDGKGENDQFCDN